MVVEQGAIRSPSTWTDAKRCQGQALGVPTGPPNQDPLLADFKEMPFDDESFQLVLFDPPHLVRDKQSFSEVRLRYGEYTSVNEQEEIGLGFAECWRVLAPGGTLVFKWAGSLERVEPHFPCDPIVGSRGPVRGAGDGLLGTRWFIFYKPVQVS